MSKSFDEIMSLTSTISCHEILEPVECQALYDTLCELSDGAVIVEVGCDYGRSSSLIMQVAHDRHFLTIHIDPWHDHGNRAAWWMEVMCELCPYHPFTLLRMTTIEAWRHIERLTPQGIDLAFIDGSHDQHLVERDLQIVATRVEPGGFLTAHDYPSAGVSDAIDAFTATGWTKHRQAGGFGVWRRG